VQEDESSAGICRAGTDACGADEGRVVLAAAGGIGSSVAEVITFVGTELGSCSSELLSASPRAPCASESEELIT